VTQSSLQIECADGVCGNLALDKTYFLSTPGDDPRTAVALSMPHRAKPYQSLHMHPIFQMSLPEGRVLEEIRMRLAKTSEIDPMLLLSITGSASPIGRLRCSLVGQKQHEIQAGESLEEILAWDGAEDLFKVLFDRYVMRSGISGVQPKVLVPERIDQNGTGRRTTNFTDDVIVKSGQAEYPHLAINEFICMSIAKEAGIPTPEFFLSKNHEIFVMRRFDRAADSTPLGFEDFAVLMNKTPAQKYETSYEKMAKAIELFVSSHHREDSLDQFFRSVTLSCMLGNGDAHLKNFGLLYTDPSSDDVRLSPAFDIVNTTMYLPDDTLALDLGGNRSMFAARANLKDFASACGVQDVRAKIESLVEAAHAVLYIQADLIGQAHGLGDAIKIGVNRFEEALEGSTY
jgi:serine/threonine-protein kinase HipA